MTKFESNPWNERENQRKSLQFSSLFLWIKIEGHNLDIFAKSDSNCAEIASEVAIYG